MIIGEKYTELKLAEAYSSKIRISDDIARVYCSPPRNATHLYLEENRRHRMAEEETTDGQKQKRQEDKGWQHKYLLK